MARDRNTFAKHQREIQKKQKKMDKLSRRLKKKERANDTAIPHNVDHPVPER
jgi:hypothetical protein